jgi:hypothetical protein
MALLATGRRNGGEGTVRAVVVRSAGGDEGIELFE